ncbi:proline dehydrogenase family protein [Saccharothrix yanglingensis]|uniref:Proline dehydrogenase n=1 Tax=Saccharothrix yanglingensis TaxID=659496 RepID=A0ABU0WS94_9PSEU|nr:proline dehydrogenase family protein [Saccharothrix yanglingensis]MDQ2582712.1 proline dehydrogenase [Saccharothrix yanglingensis]
MNPLRTSILAAADGGAVRRVVATAPVSRDLVRRFVAGETTSDALDATGELVDRGLRVALDHLGEPAADRDAAERAVLLHLDLLDQLHDVGLAGDVEVDLKPSAVGRALDGTLALDNASRVCAAAERAGTSVTLDVEDHAATAPVLGLLAELRRTWPSTGVALRASLRRTHDDCRALADTRVRLGKGARAAPASVAFTDPHEVDLNYVRCANTLLAGAGHPVFATHDPRLVEIVGERSRWYGRAREDFEHQMPYGVRPAEQARLAAEGHVVRVHVPFGRHWRGHLARRPAERPAGVASFLRSLLGRS